jgi:hypothetical protein
MRQGACDSLLKPLDVQMLRNTLAVFDRIAVQPNCRILRNVTPMWLSKQN